MEYKFWRLPGLQLECLRVERSRHSFPKHYHDSYVIELVEEGINDFWCDGHIFSAAPNDIIVIHPGEIHTGYPAGSKDLSYRSLYPTLDLMKALSHEVTGQGYAPVFRTNVIRDAVLSESFKQAHLLLESEGKNECMIAVIRDLILKYSYQQEIQLTSSLKIFPEVRLQRALDYLSQKLDQNVSLSQLSRVSGLSEFYFVRKFRKFTGLAPYEYVIATRVEVSRKLISQGVPLAEAAARTGFCDQSHLNKHFKRILGITPGKYALHL